MGAAVLGKECPRQREQPVQSPEAGPGWQGRGRGRKPWMAWNEQGGGGGEVGKREKQGVEGLVGPGEGIIFYLKRNRSH